MKRKMLQMLLGLSMALPIAATGTLQTGSVYAAETEAISEVQDTEAAEIDSETEESTEVAAEEEVVDDEPFVEGSALLSDFEYVEGKISENGWDSEFLKMEYIPENDISMGMEENEKLKEYHERHGKDKQVSINEMVAVNKSEGYVQMMVEVNPNHEPAEDILKRLTENEKLELVSKTRKMQIGGKNFLTCTGVYEKERYMLCVSDEVDDLVLAVKVKYADSDDREALLEGFQEYELEEEKTEPTSEDAAEATDETAEDSTEDESEPLSEAEVESGEKADSEAVTEEETEEKE